MPFSIQSRTILVVDDNEHNCKLVEALLEEDGFEVVAAHDGQAAIERFDEDRPSLVLLDIMMPGMSGYDVCRKIRAMPHGDDVPVVFLTALDDFGSYQRAIDAGANDFLTKPVSADELRMRTRSLLWFNQLRDEIERGSHLIRQQRNAMLASRRQRDEVMGFVIHDLKNMLASLISNAEFLSRRLADAPILEDAAEDILAVGHEMDGLTQDLLRIGQGEEGSLVVNASSVDLEFTINEVCQRFDRTAAAQSDGGDVSVAADVEAGLTAEVDEDLVVRMLDNLLDNALRYAPAGTTVDVQAWQTDADIRIEVSDQGPGIAPEFRDDVFKKYYRVDNDKKGTGVGLAFCRVVAVEHGGAIWVDENDAGGCVVCVQLPATQSQELRA